MKEPLVGLILFSPVLLFLFLLALLAIAITCLLGMPFWRMAGRSPNPYPFILLRTLDESGPDGTNYDPIGWLLLLVLAMFPTMFWDTVSLPLQLVLTIRWDHAEKARRRNKAVAKKLREATPYPTPHENFGVGAKLANCRTFLSTK